MRDPNQLKLATSSEIDLPLSGDEVERLKRFRPSVLGIKCSRTDCKKDLHCFDPRRHGRVHKVAIDAENRCADCGLVLNVKRLHYREIRDADETIAALEREWIRHFFWHVGLSDRVVRYAQRSGGHVMSLIIRERIKKRLGRYNQFQRRQTPMLRGTIIDYAWHATAVCCRECMEYWHGIPCDAELTEAQVDYLTELVMRYIYARIPEIGRS
jgi:Domain of unknown function (DUF4186)